MKKLDKTITKIAQAAGIETLEARNSDSLDFHDLSVWEIRKMLIDAYEAGQHDIQINAKK